MQKTELFNFRIPSYLKHQFKETCKKRNTAMTSILNEFIHEYVLQDPANESEAWEPIVRHADFYDDASWTYNDD